MKKVLFDSNVLSYWHGDVPQWRVPIEAFMTTLAQHGERIESYVSVVTIQELVYWARSVGHDVALLRWLETNFMPLPFNKDSALKASEFQARCPRPPRRTFPLRPVQ